MEDKLIQLAYDVLAILIPALAALAVEYLRRRLGTERLKRVQEELATKQELATLAVRFVEQVYTELHGQEKFEKAAEWLAGRAQEHGLKLSAIEIDGLIEAALRELKDSFGNEWAREVSKTS
ncbi:MAG TPA: phage holin [Alicyclobacillus sp.]|nr:phage holin [Alicyclobacillus sp.]